jgi:hypothetical protein
MPTAVLQHEPQAIVDISRPGRVLPRRWQQTDEDQEKEENWIVLKEYRVEDENEIYI